MRLAQPSQGYRVAIDPVLLAAAIAGGDGPHILDAGCGTGAAALCLAARDAYFRITGVERDAALAALARVNVSANAMDARIAIAEASFEAFAAGNAGMFDQVMTNPPFYEGDRHTRSPRDTKAGAHGEDGLDLAGWIKASSIALKPGGRLTMIHRADRLDDILRSFAGRFGAAAIFPLWPKSDSEAKRIVVTAIKGRRTKPRLLPGLILHGADSGYSAEANSILREGTPLDLRLCSS